VTVKSNERFFVVGQKFVDPYRYKCKETAVNLQPKFTYNGEMTQRKQQKASLCQCHCASDRLAKVQPQLLTNVPSTFGGCAKRGWRKQKEILQKLTELRLWKLR